VHSGLQPARDYGPAVPGLTICSDRSGEFGNSKFGNSEFASTLLMEHLAGLGIQQQFSTTQSSQQNGRAERPIQTLSNMMRVILWASKHPKAFWAEALCPPLFAHDMHRNPPPPLHPEFVDVRLLD
jgi:transposase InsO family protein